MQVDRPSGDTHLAGQVFSDRTSVLVCENSQVQLRILSEAVRDAGYEVHTASNAEDALTLLNLMPIDIFLTGIEVGTTSGLEACWLLKSNPETETVYTIVVTASGQEKRLEESLDAGADDFIRKPVNMTELRARLRAATRLVRMQKQFRHMAETDALTGAANRRAFMQYLDTLVDRARRQDAPLAAVMVDLDHFKRTNDTYGHAVGDKVLVQTVRQVQSCLRDCDMLGRLGGEEFAVVLPGATAASAVAAAERIREAIAAVDVRVDNGDRIPVTASLGVAVLEGDKMMETAEGLLHAADEALYAAKAGGRNRVVEAASCREDAPVRAVG
ncbi:diguanylate cyclase [Maricaulis sp.]|uniref:GGDEF domain-containing response regulator n=1 Tax=Maricaulis sp. TaxID=1486257 RepID=UPI001B2630F1|nr:diguanylate cyclase [Maricaulis sp.]MBO6765454.1 diguanylate cyclase [Maricaulis sp.]